MNGAANKLLQPAAKTPRLKSDVIPRNNRGTTMDSFQRVAVLEDQIEALALAAALQELDIPHGIISYYDSAYDGLFQLQRGWGHVEAPTEFANQIREMLEDIRHPSHAGQ